MNRHERRKSDALARRRLRVISRMVGGRTQALELLEMPPAAARFVLLRLAYRGFKLGRVTAADARLFGARVTRERSGKK